MASAWGKSGGGIEGLRIGIFVLCVFFFAMFLDMLFLVGFGIGVWGVSLGVSQVLECRCQMGLTGVLITSPFKQTSPYS